MSMKTLRLLIAIPCAALLALPLVASAQAPPPAKADDPAPAVAPPADPLPADPAADPVDPTAGDPETTNPATTDPAPTTPAKPTGPKLEIVNPSKPYKQLPFAASIKNDIKTQNDVVKIVNRVLSGDERLQENQAAFTGYFTQFMFPQITELDPETGLPVNDLPEIRTRFVRDFMGRADNPQAREALLETTYTYMWGIIRGRFHPVSQYNAMLIVGELNISEARTGGSNPSPPEPLPKALQDMVAELGNPANHDALKVAALVGIQRHARLDGQKPASDRMPASKKVDIVEAVAKIIFEPKPPNRSQAGHDWMRRIAIETIGYTHDPGVGNKNAKELARILADEDESRDMRLAAAMAYAQMEFDKAPPIKTADIVGQIAAIMVKSARESVEKLHEEVELREKLAKGPSSGEYDTEGYGYGSSSEEYASDSASEGYGSLSDEPDPFALPGEESNTEYGYEDATVSLALIAARQYQVDNIARRVLYDLRRSQIALQGPTVAHKGLSGMADAKTKQAITDLAAELKKIYKVIEEKRPEGIDELTEGLEASIIDLETTVVKVAPAPTTPADVGDPGLPDGESGIPGGDPTGLPGSDPPPAKDPEEAGIPGLPG